MESIILSYDEIVFLVAVALEVKSARLAYPGNKHMLAAMSEEAGELAKAFIDHEHGKCLPQELRNEAIQTAAMALRCFAEGDSSFSYTPPKSTPDARDYGPMLWLFNKVMIERLNQEAHGGWAATRRQETRI